MNEASLKNRFLIELTKELIRNTENYKKVFIEIGVKKLLIEEEKNFRKEKPQTQTIREIKDVVREKMERDYEIASEQPLEKNIFKDFVKQLEKKKISEKLKIPVLQLPPTFRELRPKPHEAEIDLKKINSLIKDQSIRLIECKEPNEEIIVEGKMGRQKTKIVLNKSEIDEIITAFSRATKIPATRGVYRVVYGKLIFSAVISEEYGSKFVITKIPMPPASPMPLIPPKPTRASKWQ